jgi:hypothetical protein
MASYSDDDIPVESTNLIDIKGKVTKDKMSYSNFFITLNTNKDEQSASSTYKQNFDTAVKYVFDKHHIKKYLIDVNHPGSLSYKYVKSITAEYALEVGSSLHRLHCHALVSVSHKTRMKLNLDKVRQLFKAVLGDTIHLDVKVSGGGVKSIQDYITK